MKQLYELMAKKYALPHYIFLSEVRDSTGFDSCRSADAIAISLYRSRGQSITCFEYKASRADWLRELNDPQKAERIGKYCDHFFLVTTDADIAKLEEIPTAWGWMAVKGQRLKVMKPALSLESVPMSRAILCALLYATKERFLDEGRASVDSLVAERLKQERDYRERMADNNSIALNKLREDVAAFEQASGINILHRWHGMDKTGAAVRIVLEKGNIVEHFKKDLRFSLDRANSIATQIERELKSLGADGNSGEKEIK